MQSSADAAVLAAVTAAASGASVTDAETAASNVWSANAARISSSQNTINAPTINVQTVNGLTSASVSYSGAQQTSFTGIIGINSLQVAGSSGAQWNQIVTASTGVSGAGGAYGDPHILGADGNTFRVPCPAPNWYDLVSDYNIEVNVACYHDGRWSYDVINQVSFVLNGHVVQFLRPALDLNGDPITPFDPSSILVDGVTQSVALGQTGTYLNGTVTYTYAASDWASSYSNVLAVNTPTYAINVTFGSNGGTITITATGAGLCGTPDGVWGNTLAGIDDTNMSDFQVPDPAFTDAAYSRGSCTVAQNGQLGPHLTN